MTKRQRTNFLPAVYLIFGIYFLNFGLNYFSVPETIMKLNNWVVSFGGVLFFIAAYRAIVYSKGRILRRAVRHAR